MPQVLLLWTAFRDILSNGFNLISQNSLASVKGASDGNIAILDRYCQIVTKNTSNYDQILGFVVLNKERTYNPVEIFPKHILNFLLVEYIQCKFWIYNMVHFSKMFSMYFFEANPPPTAPRTNK